MSERYNSKTASPVILERKEISRVDKTEDWQRCEVTLESLARLRLHACDQTQSHAPIKFSAFTDLATL